jgi:ArsR family transcriptional regulator
MSLDRIVAKDTSDTLVDGQEGCKALSPDQMVVQATAAAGFLKALSHEGRLMILCHLSSGEKSVTELERLLESRQAAVSQQLARLRLEGLVSCRREGKVIFYSIQDPKVSRTIALVYDMFCKAAAEG